MSGLLQSRSLRVRRDDQSAILAADRYIAADVKSEFRQPFPAQNDRQSRPVPVSVLFLYLHASECLNLFLHLFCDFHGCNGRQSRDPPGFLRMDKK